MHSLLCLLTLMITLWVSPNFAQPLTPEQVPEPLKPWVEWVLKDHPERLCPFVYNQFEQKYCRWPTELTLSLSNTQGNFSGFWQVDHESWVTLPGDERFWPQQVVMTTVPKSSAQPALVVAKDNLPALFLKPGRYEIQGQFNWDFIPEQLQIPDDTGLINLSINGNAVTMPTLKEGLLWIKDSERGSSMTGNAADKLDMQVFRRVMDDVPLQVMTHIDLDVAGKAREITLPQALLQGFTPMQLNSPLPARIETNGQVLLQVRPGHWQLTLLARQTNPDDIIALQALPNWLADEVWVVEARPALRVVEVVDLAAIDPSQTNLPADWKNLPAYRIKAGEAMKFKVLRRGNPDPEPNQLTLNRKLWLDFDGLGYTIKDQLSGMMTRDWRLSALPETQLGKVSLNGQNQLITRLNAKDVGVEVRQGALNVEADSRYQGAIGHLAVTGWQHTFQQVRAEINLPPGWRLLAASGVDNVPDTWLARWTLLDIFMVLIASLAVAHLWDKRWGMFALVTLVLIWHEPAAPHFSWLHLLVATALIKLMPLKTDLQKDDQNSEQAPRHKLLMGLQFYQRMSQLAVCLIALPFMLMQVRTALYPQLEMPWQVLQADAQPQAPVASAPALLEDKLGAAKSEAPARILAKQRSASESDAEFNYYSVLPAAEIAKAKAYGRTDPQANVQTGPGLPQWQWHSVHLAWNGSVDSQQQVQLWFLSPIVNCVLNFLRIGLLMVLALLLFGVLPKVSAYFPKNTPTPGGGISGSLGLLVVLVFCLHPQPVKAEFPPQTVLDELKTRLLTPPDCLPSCAEIALLQVDINPATLKLNLQVDAQYAVAVPLPAQQRQWLPEQVLLDGDAHAPLLRDAEGQLWLKISKGRHAIVLQGATPALDKFSLALPLKPHRVMVTENGWAQTGVHEHGISDPQLQFTRVNTTAATGTNLTLVPSALPPLFRLERTLHLGLDWHVSTQVVRLTPPDTAAFLAVPLIAGESVLTAGVRVDKQQVLLNIDAAQTQAGWDSVLEQHSPVDLQALATNQWTEVWQVAVSPLWHLQSEGIASIHSAQTNEWLQEWRPLPGEKLRLQLTKPEAVDGQTLTLERSQLTVAPGKRITENTLSLTLQSSKGGQHTLTLPANIDLQTVKVNDVLQPIRQQAGEVVLPVKPGTQNWQLVWQTSQAFVTRFATPEINVGTPSVNSHIKLLPGQDRWVLFTFGPRLGPAVLFWGYLLVISLFAFGLSRSDLTPLKAWQWFLLLLGLSQISVEQALLVVGWFWLIGLRKRSPLAKATSFNGLQVLIVALTLMAGVCLFLAVEQGLLGSPDMQISGNQSNAMNLNWYQDRTGEVLPIAGIISVPLLEYRGLMLLWSLWLAVSVLQWLKWGWQGFATDGLWRKLPPAKPKPEKAKPAEKSWEE